MTKLIAIYFPQFHSVPENDKWWGEGFTDWDLVKTAKPLFIDHNQPRRPLTGYYNPCDENIIGAQIEIAKKYGVFGFMFYHYWFDGKLILEKPLETFLSNKDLDIPFCLSWANGTWTRQWIGNNEILLEQKSIPDKELWTKHFYYLLPFFRDSRAIKINDKPVFAVYNPDFIKENKAMFELWKKLAVQNGLKGIYFIAMKNYEFASNVFLENYNAVLKYQPREAHNSSANPARQKLLSIRILRGLPERLQVILAGIRLRMKRKTIVSSEETWEHIISNAYSNEFGELDIFETAFFDWDNSARYGKKATIYSSLTMDQKHNYLKRLYEKAAKHEAQFLFFNAWNEWSESAYLEPDEKDGYKHLEIIKSVFGADR